MPQARGTGISLADWAHCSPVFGPGHGAVTVPDVRLPWGLGLPGWASSDGHGHGGCDSEFRIAVPVMGPGQSPGPGGATGPGRNPAWIELPSSAASGPGPVSGPLAVTVTVTVTVTRPGGGWRKLDKDSHGSERRPRRPHRLKPFIADGVNIPSSQPVHAGLGRLSEAAVATAPRARPRASPAPSRPPAARSRSRRSASGCSARAAVG